jgi:hypothetical protein
MLHSSHNVLVLGVVIASLLPCFCSPAVFAQTGSLPADSLATDTPRADSQQVWHDVTLITRDGWEYAGVSLALTADGTGLRVTRPDGAVKTFPFSAIRSIHGPTGEDITAVIFPAAASGQRSSEGKWDRGYKEVGYVPPEGQPARYKPPRRFSFALSGGVGYGIAEGNWFTGLNNGFSFLLQGRVNVGNKVYMGFTFRNQDLNVTNTVLAEFAAGLDLDSTLREYIVAFGFHSEVEHSRQVFTYFEVGLSWMDHVFKAEYQGESESETVDEGAFSLQTGVIVPMSDQLAIDAALSWMYKGLIFTDDNEASGSVFGIQIALVALFGSAVGP